MAQRDYQAYAVNETFNYLYNATGNGIIVMPTGTGKSHIIAGIVERALYERPNARIHMLTDKQELIQQNLDKLVEAWPLAPVGVFSAGLGSKQKNTPIIFGGIGSMIKAVDDIPAPDLTLIDECHMFGPNHDAMYGAYHAAMRKRNPWLRSVGTTATPWRLGQGSLTEPGSFFTDTIVNAGSLHAFNWFVDQGYLVKLLARPTETKYDFSGVGISNGEYKPGDVQKAMDKPEMTWRALEELCHYGQDRRKWLIFASGVDHADHIYEMLLKKGISCTVVHRGIPKAERMQRIADYKAGKYRAIVNNNILTKGFDDTGIDLIAVLRLTMSSSLWVQMLGRGTRPHYARGFNLETQEGRLLAIANSYKRNCLVLDFAANAADLGPINDPVIPKAASGKSGDPPIKICETSRLKNRANGAVGCGMYNHPSVRYCDHCNQEFDFAIKFGSNSSTLDVMSDGKDAFEWFDVIMTGYSAHTGPSGKTYLRVDYWVNKKKRFSDIVNLNQTGFILHQAKEWWKARCFYPHWDAPPSVEAALPYCNRNYLKEPKKIRVWHKADYPEVVNYEYE